MTGIIPNIGFHSAIIFNLNEGIFKSPISFLMFLLNIFIDLNKFGNVYLINCFCNKIKCLSV